MKWLETGALELHSSQMIREEMRAQSSSFRGQRYGQIICHNCNRVGHHFRNCQYTNFRQNDYRRSNHRQNDYQQNFRSNDYRPNTYNSQQSFNPRENFRPNNPGPYLPQQNDPFLPNSQPNTRGGGFVRATGRTQQCDNNQSN